MSHSYAPWGLVVYILFTLLRFYTWINEFHVYLISDGCVRNVPTDLPQPKQKSDNGYKVVPENHRLPCTTNETLAKSCLNELQKDHNNYGSAVYLLRCVMHSLKGEYASIPVFQIGRMDSVCALLFLNYSSF
jgi:hypothetical protein